MPRFVKYSFVKKVILKIPTSTREPGVRSELHRPSRSVMLRFRVSSALLPVHPQAACAETHPWACRTKPVVFSRSRRIRISGAGLPDVESSTAAVDHCVSTGRAGAKDQLARKRCGGRKGMTRAGPQAPGGGRTVAGDGRSQRRGRRHPRSSSGEQGTNASGGRSARLPRTREGGPRSPSSPRLRLFRAARAGNLGPTSTSGEKTHL